MLFNRAWRTKIRFMFQAMVTRLHSPRRPPHPPAPEQRHAVRAGRDVLQSRIAFAGKMYLLRVFVDIDRYPAEVITVYRTRRIGKYWRA